MYKIRLFREDGAGAGGGSKQPSLADLDNDSSYKAPAPAPAPSPGASDIQPGDGTPKPPVLGADGKPVPKQGEGGKPEPKPGDADYVAKPGDEGYVPKKGEEGYVLQPGDEGYVEPPQEQFWEVVEKLTGKKVEVQYPDGVEPDTPEGAAVRETAVRTQAIQEFEAYLEQDDPRAYAYAMHRKAGKSDEEFFGNKRVSYTLPDIASVEQSADLQAAVYKHDLIAKGVDEDEAESLVQAAIKSNKLKDKAIASHKAIDTAQKEQVNNLKIEQEKIQQVQVQAETRLLSTIKDTMADMSLIVPEAEKPRFEKFFIDNLQYDQASGKFLLVQELSEKELKLQMESMLFQFMKGNLDNIAKKKAGTIVAQKLRLQAGKANGAPIKDQSLGGSAKSKLTLGEI